MTYSIIAFDYESGAYGVAIQSHWFNVGRDAPWVRYGVGAVATQGTTDPSYGWRGLDAMAGGQTPQGALASLLSQDPRSEIRQVGMIDDQGRVAVHTGSACIAHASHEVGDGWAVMGNLLKGPDVIDAMAERFPLASGTLAERMVAAIEAAEDAGGDLRGRQSAAIRVSPGSQELAAGDEPGIDISIADHHDPVSELRRLVEVDRAYRALRRGGRAIDVGRRDEALAQFDLASQLRHGVEVDFWRAIGLARLGQLDRAIGVLRNVFEENAAFEELLDRGSSTDETMRQLADRLRSG